MEYCAVRGIFHQRLCWTKQEFDIHQDVGGRFTIAAIHEIHVPYQDKPDTVYKLLDLRVQNLVPYILQGFEGLESISAKDIKCALESAFQRVDKEVQRRAQELDFKGKQAVLETRLNSSVVVIHDGFVYVAGAAEADIFLGRDSKPFYLTSRSHRICKQGITMTDIPMSKERILFYFRQERLQATDAYLVMASHTFRDYLQMLDFMLPILQSRIDVVGLNEACKSMVGPYRDANKILIVITLQPGAHLPKDSIQPVAEELLDTTKYDPLLHKKVPVKDPLRYLLPYVNGKKQHPVPLTTSVYTDYHSVPQPCPLDEIKIVSSLETEAEKKQKRVETEDEAAASGCRSRVVQDATNVP